MTEATIQQGDIAGAAAKYRRFNVDLWATDINDVEIGVFLQSRYRAKSEQFTKDTDVIGQVVEDGRRTGILSYREGLWKNKTGAKRRLVLKLFSESMNWRATMDMTVGRSLQLTHGADGVPVTCFSVNVGRHEQLIQVERSADQWALFPEKFSFFVLTENGPRYYKLRQNLFSIGRDYSLWDQEERRIGYLDGKALSVGGLWKVKILAEHDSPILSATLQLFCAMLRFNKAARRHVRRLSRDMRAGKEKIAIDPNERDLYLNPRRAR